MTALHEPFVDGFAGVRYVKANQQVTTAMLDLPRPELSWADGASA
jgi:hypothetical protein